MTPLDYASRCSVLPPDGREAAYRFAEWSPEYHLRDDGTPVPFWEATQIVRVKLPAGLPYLDGRMVTRVAVHRLVAGYLLAALEEIQALGYWHLLAPFGGGYTFRRSRGSDKMSMHALGLAIDINPTGNPFQGSPVASHIWTAPGGREVIRAFEVNGWYWGGRFNSNPDAMHFQFATGV